MYKRILVPLDGSDTAEIVLPYVEEITAKLGAEIVLVSVSEPAAAGVDHLHHSYLEQTKEQVQRQLEDWRGKEKAKVQSRVLMGEPASEILGYADESNVDLIAMASRGRSSQGPWLLGNVAAKVLRATGRLLLLIRAPASDTALQEKRLVKRILVPLDGSGVGAAAIPHVEALAQALGAELVLFQVLETVTTWTGLEAGASQHMPQGEENILASALPYLEGVEQRLNKRGLTTSSVAALGSPADQIISYAEAHDIDLIAMSTHGRSGIGRWVFGSVTDKVLHAGNTAVLVVRATKE